MANASIYFFSVNWFQSVPLIRYISGEPNSGAEWVQFDLGRVRTIVGIATKGRYDFPQWVMSYHVQYSVSETADDTSWEYIRDLFGNIQVRKRK